MSTRFIVNQDRDQIFRLDSAAFMYSTPIIFEGKCWALNLMMGSTLLGTFDSPENLVREISAIYNSTCEIYAVSGFSDFNTDGLF